MVQYPTDLLAATAWHGPDRRQLEARRWRAGKESGIRLLRAERTPKVGKHETPSHNPRHADPRAGARRALRPRGALAGGPLLSGYGGPGAGAQAIIGGTLLNGPGKARAAAPGGSAGGSSSSSSSVSSSSPRLPLAARSGVASERAGRGGRLAGGGSAARGGTVAGESRRPAGHPLGARRVLALSVPGSVPGRLGERGVAVVLRRGPAGAGAGGRRAGAGCGGHRAFGGYPA